MQGEQSPENIPKRTGWGFSRKERKPNANSPVGDLVAVPAPHQLCWLNTAAGKAPAESECNGAEGTSSL